MLYAVCSHIKNFFVSSRTEGSYSIKAGTIDLPFILNGQYFMIKGSILNDGIYKYPVADLTDEDFTGEIVGMAIPKEFIDLVEEIKAYEEKSAQNVGPYVSESFGGYSYTKATDKSGAVATWQSAFASKLKTWRKL